MTDGANPVAGATVFLVDGDQTSLNPQDMSVYRRQVTTDANGAWTFLFETTGTKTVFVHKDGYQHASMAYDFVGSQQNIVFPDVALASV